MIESRHLPQEENPIKNKHVELVSRESRTTPEGIKEWVFAYRVSNWNTEESVPFLMEAACKGFKLWGAMSLQESSHAVVIITKPQI